MESPRAGASMEPNAPRRSIGVRGSYPGGGVMWDMFYGLLHFGVNTAYNTVHGTTGLIPELGAYVFAVAVNQIGLRLG